MTHLSLEDVRTLLDAPSAAVLTLVREDGTALMSPVWYRWADGAFEVVIAEGDPKLRHLHQNPDCTLVIFETVAPFRGVEVAGQATLRRGDMTEIRQSMAGPYLGTEAGKRFAADRVSKPGVLLHLPGEHARVWSLAGILPAVSFEIPQAPAGSP